MDQREFFRDLYYFEHERTSRLTTNLAVPIAILTLVFGVITYYVRNFAALGSDSWSVAFWITFGATLLSLSFAIYFLIRSFYNYGYAYPPMPSDIDDDIERIGRYYDESYFKDHRKEEKDRLIGKDVDALILGYYKQCLKVNIPNNNRKSKYLHNCSSALIAVIILLFLSSVPFWIKYHSGPDPRNAEATHFIQEVRPVSDEQRQNDKPPESPPPKPEPARIQIIKEHKEKPEEQPREKPEND